MNKTFVFLSIFGILAGLTGHATNASTPDTATATDSTVDAATTDVSTDASTPTADGGSSSTITDPAATATDTTVDAATTDVSTDGGSSGGSDSSSGTTAESNTASGMSGTTTADSASSAAADNCYSLIHSCNQTTNLTLCFEDFREDQTIETCPRNGKYCQVKGTVKDNTTTIEAGCVESSCNYNDYTSDSEGHVTINCCSSALCNEEKLLYAGSPSLRGALPLVLLAAAAAVAVNSGGGSTAGTNILV